MTTRPDLPAVDRRPRNWVDEQLIETGWLMLIALAALFFVLVWVFAAVGLLAAGHPVARRKAKILFGICTVYAAVVGLLVYAVVRGEA
ncbi:MAG: hypothetical protein JWO31_1416 [Phycisphaerales bacterium]|nr:hypothetical protein [Phycisphaerales bacterium]